MSYATNKLKPEVQDEEFQKQFLIKSILFYFYVISIFYFFLTLSSCSEANKTQSVIKSVSEVEPTTDAGKTYQKFMVTTLTFAEKSVELLAKYDIGIPNDYEKASAGGFLEGSDTGVIDMKDIISNLPNDLNTVTRKRVTETEVNGVMVASEEEVTLADEMAKLEAELVENIKEIQPDITDATTLDFVSRVDNNTIQIGGDMTIRNDDMSGAITIELLNAEARGEDVDTVLADMGIVTEALNENAEDVEEFDNESSLNDEGVAPTGTFQNNTHPWRLGIVFYNFINVPQHVQEMLLAAMNEWEKLTGVVRFYNCNNSTAPLWTISYGISCISISMESMPPGTYGQATPGFQPYNSGTLKLNNIFSSTNLDNSIKTVLMTTIKHELGHTLGLQHEHQRPDRDTYITLPSSNDSVNLGKLPDKTKSGSYLKVIWVKKRVRIWFISFYIYYPQFYIKDKYTYINQRTPDYDYFSIMHYHENMDTKNLYNIGSNHRCSYLFNNPKDLNSAAKECMEPDWTGSTQSILINDFITNKDILAVQKMYGKGGW